MTESGAESLRDKAIAALRTVFDPELPINIYELGLIYDLTVDDDHAIHVRMTLTAPNCPVAGSLPGQVEAKLAAIPGVRGATVELVWDPPWTRDRMTEAAKLELGLLFDDEPPRKPFVSIDALRGRRP